MYMFENLIKYSVLSLQTFFEAVVNEKPMEKPQTDYNSPELKMRVS